MFILHMIHTFPSKVSLIVKIFFTGQPVFQNKGIKKYYTNPKFTIWCPIWKIIQQFFFENDVTVTVPSERYINMIQNFVVLQLQVEVVDRLDVGFQQDGVTDHIASISMDTLKRLLPEKVIRSSGDKLWPPD